MIEQGKIGMLMQEGMIVRTLSGRQTTPFPRIDLVTNRKVTATLKRSVEWLRGNAIAEAQAKGDEFALFQFKITDLKRLSQADTDSMEYYLFDY